MTEIEQATKAMHAEVCCPCDPKGCDWTRTREVRHAWVLADAGLLARPLPTREQLADTLWDALEDGGWVSTSGHYPYEIADAVLALMKGQHA